MRIHINPGDGVPIYRQVIKQMKYLIASGRLSPGDELPPIRKLAQALLINPNTVARAYRDLEQEGLLQSRQGSGTVVADSGSPLSLEVRERILADEIDGVIAISKQLNFSRDEFNTAVEKRYVHLNQEIDAKELSHE